MDTRWLYVALIAAVVLERLAELVLTRRNSLRLEARGGFEVGSEHFPAMAALHTALLIAAPLEVFWLERPFHPLWGSLALAALVLTMALRYWAVMSLGDRWTAKIFVVPGEPPVARGPYRFLRHPNYLAVIGEVAALPLIHGAWLTALVFTLANAWMLKIRISVEEKALSEHSNYRQRLGDRPRFVPSPRAGGGNEE